MLILLLLTLVPENGNTIPEIIIAPESMRVGLGHPPLSLHCEIRGDDLCWMIDGVLLNAQTKATFRNRGITVSGTTHHNNIASGTMTITVTTLVNNNTEVVCEALAAGSSPVLSNPAIIFIADVPVPPSLEFSVVDILTVQVEWEAPFSWEDFPITNYTVLVDISHQNTTSEQRIAILGPDILSYNLTQQPPTSACSNVTFSVHANNSVGSSPAGTTQGSFPAEPGVFMQPPRSEVTFTQNNLPILDIIFMFPSICAYQTATYQVDIEELSSNAVVHTVGPLTRDWRETDPLVTAELREGLQLNRFYSAIVTVSTLAGEERTNVLFNTTTDDFTSATPTQATGNNDSATTMNTTTDDFTSATPTQATGNNDSATTMTPHTEINVLAIVLTCIGTVFVMFVFVVIGLCSVYWYRRSVRRNREHRGVTEAAGIRPMVNNPIYEGGAIYEAIPDLKSLSLYKEGKEFEVKDDAYAIIANPGATDMTKPLDPQDDTYTMMTSAGPLRMSNGAAASTEAACDRGGQSTKEETEERYVLFNN